MCLSKLILNLNFTMHCYQSRDIRFNKQTLLDSLKETHIYNKDVNKVVFTKLNITLNIDNAIRCLKLISVELKKLLSYKQDLLRLAFLFQQDSDFTLHIVKQDEIVSIKGKALDLLNASMLCSMILKHPKDSKKQQF